MSKQLIISTGILYVRFPTSAYINKSRSSVFTRLLYTFEYLLTAASNQLHSVLLHIGAFTYHSTFFYLCSVCCMLHHFDANYFP